jgi:hypothetical protein
VTEAQEERRQVDHLEAALHLEEHRQEAVVEALEAVELRHFQEAFQPVEEEAFAHQQKPSFHRPFVVAWKQALEPVLLHS